MTPTPTQFSWIATVGATILSCAQAQASLAGEVNLRFAGESKSRVVFVLENGSNQTLYLRGVNDSRRAVNPWDGSIDCRFTKTSSSVESLLLGHKDGTPRVIGIPPNERVNLSFDAYESIFFAKHRREFCILHLELQSHETIDSNEFVP